MLELFSQPEAWISLITLTVMEIVLGIDNVIFISLVTGKLEKSRQVSARRIGLFLALFIRIVLLSFLANIVQSKQVTLFSFASHDLTIRDLVLLAGGLFLLYKSTLEIFELLEHETEEKSKQVKAVFWNVVLQVILIDIVFSFDSIITAVGLAQDLPIMILAVIVSMIIMLFFSGLISDFINQHPSVKLLALAFLLVIGLMLVIEGWNHEIAEQINLKAYVYFAMAFSIAVELLNMKMRKKGKNDKPVELKDIYK